MADPVSRCLMLDWLSRFMAWVKRIFFVSGTDTAVGKTVLTVLMTRYLRSRGINAAALKPICSGGRADARAMARANDGLLSLNQINPWRFKRPIAPALAARLEGICLNLPTVAARAKAIQRRFDILFIEGAGGLLSPLGRNFNSRDLIARLDAVPIIAAPNRLGVVNHVLLTLEALPLKFRARARVVLLSFGKADASRNSNQNLIAEFFDRKRIFSAADPDFAAALFEPLL
ncbi:MAG: dethiobiotin synthase [Limisphaerales bacterium]